MLADQTMDSRNNITVTEGGVSDDELNQARRIFTSLLLTVKNLSLYPHGHTICVNSIKQFYTQLTAFLDKYNTLMIEIEREQIVYRGKAISSEIPEEGSLHYTLFRDGIRWLELNNGIEHDELADILLIINRYNKLSTEPEGDIVTALWETHFPHIQYEVADIFRGGDRETGKFSDLVSGKSAMTRYAEPEYREKEYRNDPEIDPRAIALSPEEEAALKEMVRMEEDTELTSYLDALLDSLLQHEEEVNFSKILDAISEEFILSVSRNDFSVTLKILQGLQYVLDICSEDMPWAVKLIDDFLIKASNVDFLAPLKESWGQIDPEDTEVLREIFMLLNPDVIRMLVALLSQSQPAPLRKMLLDLIVLLASKDTRNLEMALNNANENLLERLVSVIVRMEPGQAMKYLTKLSQHSSGRIRYEAVRGILKLDPARIKDMLNLIDDKEDSLRQLVLEQMGQSRNEAVEEFLLSYINKNKTGTVYADHIIQCFRILGRCGSARSVPFLRQTLIRWGFLSSSRRPVLRRGAAIALATLGITEADKVLERAGRSFFPGVKNVVSKVRQELKEEAESRGK